jgi:hypothetical protein
MPNQLTFGGAPNYTQLGVEGGVPGGGGGVSGLGDFFSQMAAFRLAQKDKDRAYNEKLRNEEWAREDWKAREARRQQGGGEADGRMKQLALLKAEDDLKLQRAKTQAMLTPLPTFQGHNPPGITGRGGNELDVDAISRNPLLREIGLPQGGSFAAPGGNPVEDQTRKDFNAIGAANAAAGGGSMSAWATPTKRERARKYNPDGSVAQESESESS